MRSAATFSRGGADGRGGQEDHDRRQQPAATAGQGAAHLDEHPAGQGQHRRRPHPGEGGEGRVLRGEDQEAGTGGGHRDRGDGGPPLGLAGHPWPTGRASSPSRARTPGAADPVMTLSVAPGKTTRTRTRAVTAPAISEPAMTRATGRTGHGSVTRRARGPGWCWCRRSWRSRSRSEVVVALRSSVESMPIAHPGQMAGMCAVRSC